MKHNVTTGLVEQATFIASPNCDDRPKNTVVEAIIVHSISLPPGEYGNGYVKDFFCNHLDTDEHPYFTKIAHLTVSSHFFIQRDGALTQFVPTHQRAWHAGESMCLSKPAANNFSIGVELEGLDTGSDGYTDEQYRVLKELIDCLRKGCIEIGTNNIFAHSDIAPGRKTDPGPYFDWNRIV